MVRLAPSLLLAMLLVPACGRGAPDAEARAKAMAAADPAITAALADPIMTDRDLSVADNSRRVRTVAGPGEANYPVPGGDNEAAFAALRALGTGPACERGFTSGARFAAELPLPFRPAPSATVVEAGGNDRPGCRARYAVFRTRLVPASVATEAARRAAAAGYAAETRVRGVDRIVAGRRRGGGSGFYLVVSPQDAGSEIAVIAVLP